MRAPVRTAVLLTMTLAAPALIPGCSAGRSGSPYATPSEADRDSLKAQRLTQEAAAILDTNPDKAERLLRDALTADLYHGPAHNNLGVIYLNRGMLYEAASEFEWARKLLPNLPDPRMNLALTLEKAGRTDEALATYASALEVYPGHIPTLQAMTRLQVRAGKTDAATAAALEELALKGETPEWRAWAQAVRTRLASPR